MRALGLGLVAGALVYWLAWVRAETLRLHRAHGRRLYELERSRHLDEEDAASWTCRVCFRSFEVVDEDAERICIDCLEQRVP